MDFLLPLALIAGGLLAAAGLLVSKSPNAKKIIDALMPFQALIGAGLLVLGVLFLVQNVSFLTEAFKFPMLGVIVWGMVVAAIGLGIMFGMPMVARFSPAGAAKGQEVAAKLAPYQTLLGLIAIGCGLAALLLKLGILKLTMLE
jgi:hypothetical protein